MLERICIGRHLGSGADSMDKAGKGREYLGLSSSMIVDLNRNGYNDADCYG